MLSATGQVDLLLTDVVLPGGMSGPALAAAARRDQGGMKVLFMSGYTEEAIGHHGRLEPGTELLTKPFSIKDLGDRLRAILDG